MSTFGGRDSGKVASVHMAPAADFSPEIRLNWPTSTGEPSGDSGCLDSRGLAFTWQKLGPSPERSARFKSYLSSLPGSVIFSISLIGVSRI